VLSWRIWNVMVQQPPLMPAPGKASR